MKSNLEKADLLKTRTQSLFPLPFSSGASDEGNLEKADPL